MTFAETKPITLKASGGTVAMTIVTSLAAAAGFLATVSASSIGRRSNNLNVLSSESVSQFVTTDNEGAFLFTSGFAHSGACLVECGHTEKSFDSLPLQSVIAGMKIRGDSTLIRTPMAPAILGIYNGLLSALDHRCPVVLEELTDPEDSEAEPRVFVLAQVSENDEISLSKIDEFILGEWSSLPVAARRVIRVGSEFV